MAAFFPCLQEDGFEAKEAVGDRYLTSEEGKRFQRR